MKNINKFIDKYGNEVLNDYLEDLLFEYSLDDELEDDEGCICKKAFLKWLEYYEYLKT